MTQKRLFQVVGILIAAVWVASGILAFGVLRARKNKADEPTLPPLSSTTAPAITTTAPTTTTSPFATIGGNSYGTTEAPTSDSMSTSGSYPTSGGFFTSDSAATTNAFTPGMTAQSAEPTTAGVTVPSGKSAVIAAYLNAVNTLKNTPDFKLVKTEKLNVVLDEIEPSSVRSMASKIIESNSKTAPVTYNFSGGTDAASGLSPNNVIAPIGRQASVGESGVQSATATATAGGGYKMHLTFGRDVQTLSSAAPIYSGVFETINNDSMGLPASAKVDDFTVTYDNSSIDATVDSSGRLVSLVHHVTVVNSEGHGSLVMSVTTKMHGDNTETYDISY